MTDFMPTPCEITYSVELEDAVAFNEFYCENAPDQLLAMRRKRWLLPLICLGYAVVMWHWELNNFSTILFLLVAVGWLVFSPRWLRSKRQSVATRFYRTHENVATYGLEQLRAAADGLHVYSDLVETCFSWVEIERIGRTPSHVFIFFQANGAATINRNKIHAGDLDGFVAACEEFRRRAGNTNGTISAHGS